MTGSCHTDLIRSKLRDEFFAFLKSVPSPIRLVVDESLISNLDIGFKFTELEKNGGVAGIHVWSEKGVKDFKESSDFAYVYIVRSFGLNVLPLMNVLAEIITKGKRSMSRRHLVFCPVGVEYALNRLELLGVRLDTDLSGIHQLKWFDSAVLDSDIISLQVPGRETGELEAIARLVKRIESEFGLGVGHDEIMGDSRKFKKINSIGPKAKFVCDLFLGQAGERRRVAGVGEPSAAGDDEALEGVVSGLGRLGGIKTVSSVFQKIGNDITDDSESIDPSMAIESMVVIDRECDLFSVLCSQFTYEAQLDERYGVNNNRVNWTGKNGEKNVAVLSSDPLFDEIKDVSVSQIGGLLSQKAAFISECYKEKDALKTISEVKDFMDKFKVIQAQHASLTTHVELATECGQHMRSDSHTYLLKIEDQIMSMSKPVGKMLPKLEKLVRSHNFNTPNQIMRLLCLCSLVYGPKALSSDKTTSLVKSLVSRYGIRVVKQLAGLDKLGLFKLNKNPSGGMMTDLIGSGTKWPKMREEFKLIIDPDVNDPLNATLAESYSGYVPISTRLVQLLNTSWKNSVDKLNLLKGPAIEVMQECPIQASATGDSVYVLVVFVGGVTYSEIATLRKLSQLENSKRKFVIATTSIISSARVFDSL